MQCRSFFFGTPPGRAIEEQDQSERLRRLARTIGAARHAARRVLTDWRNRTPRTRTK